MHNTFRQIGIAVGIAVLGILFQDQVETKLDDTLATGPAARCGRSRAIWLEPSPRATRRPR